MFGNLGQNLLLPPCCVAGGDLELSLETWRAAGAHGLCGALWELGSEFPQHTQRWFDQMWQHQLCQGTSFKKHFIFWLHFGKVSVRLLHLQKAENCSVGGEGKWESVVEGMYVCLLERIHYMRTQGRRIKNISTEKLQRDCTW